MANEGNATIRHFIINTPRPTIKMNLLPVDAVSGLAISFEVGTHVLPQALRQHFKVPEHSASVVQLSLHGSVEEKADSKDGHEPGLSVEEHRKICFIYYFFVG